MRIKAENQKNSVSLSNNEIHTSGIGSDTINNVVKATNNLSEYWANQAEGSAKKAKQSEENASISAENASKSEINVNNALEEVKTIANGFDEHVVVKTNEFDEHTVTKQGEFDIHVTEKQNDFDVNALTLIARYDNNDLARTKAFNKNAEEKQALVDASVDLARKAANGTIEEYPNGSAEYWAGKAEEAASGKVIDDTIVATDKTYSSSKIEAELEKKKNKTITILKNPINDGYYLEGNENANTIYNYVYGDKTSVELAFDDIITNTGEQIYPFETFDKDRNAIFRRNIITKDKVERINIKVNYQGTVTFEPVQFEAGSGLPVGTIFAHSASSTFVPENSLPCDGTEYAQTQFPTLYTDWLVGKKLETCTYEEYQQEVTTNGACAKFGIDTVKGMFKVPLIPDGYYIKKGQGTANKAGLPNVRGQVYARGIGGGNSDVLGWESGCFYRDRQDTRYEADVRGDGRNEPAFAYKFDASRSNSIYGASDTVETNAVAYRYFVVVATGSIKQSEMDWSAWASSLQGKVNTDLGNTTPKLADSFVDKLMPDFVNKIQISFPYTVPCAGIFYANVGTDIYLKSNLRGAEDIRMWGGYTHIGITSGGEQTHEFQVSKGETFTKVSENGKNRVFFVPYKGVINA